MTDRLTVTERSAQMSRIRCSNTKPELTLRQLVHRLGYRYRLHRGDLPGRPDLVFPSRRKVIFVHGCFWHQHSGCRDATMPKSRTEFWTEKLLRNVQRDREQHRSLIATGWAVHVVWECELGDISLPGRVDRFLKSHSPSHAGSR